MKKQRVGIYCRGSGQEKVNVTVIVFFCSNEEARRKIDSEI